MKCEICGKDKIQQGENWICFNCAGKKSPKPKADYKPPVDPGEKWFKKEQNSIPTVPKSAPKQTVSVTVDRATFEEHVEKALFFMENVPMPKDIKKFKATHRVIKQLKSLLGVNDGK